MTPLGLGGNVRVELVAKGWRAFVDVETESWPRNVKKQTQIRRLILSALPLAKFVDTLKSKPGYQHVRGPTQWQFHIGFGSLEAMFHAPGREFVGEIGHLPIKPGDSLERPVARSIAA